MAMKKEKWDYLSEEDINQFNSEKIPYTDESQQMIYQHFFTKRKNVRNKKKEKMRVFSCMIATLLLVCLVGFTNRNQLAPIFRHLFGLPGNQFAERISTANLTDMDEDQGIKMQALSAFQDGNTTYFLYTLTDTTEDRLDKKMTIDRWKMSNGGNTQVIDYDSQTKTATLLVQANSIEGEKKEKGYQLERILSGYDEKTVSFPELNLTKEISRKADWFEDEKSTSNGGYDEKAMRKLGLDFDKINKFLVPMKVNQPLIYDPDIMLSNIGYKEGLLHVQIKIPNQINFETAFVNLVHRETGKEVPFVYSVQVGDETHNNDTGRTDYIEYVFDIKKEALKDYKLEIYYFGYKEKIKGNWRIALKEPVRLPEISLPSTAITVEGQTIQLKDLKLSPLSVSYFIDKSVTRSQLSAIEMAVLLKDGTRVNMEDVSVEQMKNGWKVRYSGNYLDEKKVKSIKINDQQIDISNNQN